MPGRIMSATAHGNLEPIFLREFECNDDVARTRTSCDYARAAIDQRIEAPTCRFVLFVATVNNGPGQRTAQLVDVHRCYSPFSRDVHVIEGPASAEPIRRGAGLRRLLLVRGPPSFGSCAASQEPHRA